MQQWKENESALTFFIYTVKHMCKLKQKYPASIQSRATMGLQRNAIRIAIRWRAKSGLILLAYWVGGNWTATPLGVNLHLLSY